MEISEWKQRVEVERREKDTFFKTPFQSPLSFNECQKFKGLSYYPSDWSYRFELDLQEHRGKRSGKDRRYQGK